MHRIVKLAVVIGIIGVVGIMTVQADEKETPTPTVIETVTPTPTPTVIDIACNELLLASVDAYVSFIVLQDKSQEDASKAHVETYQRIFNRLKGLEAFTKDKEAHLLHRLVGPMRKQYDQTWVRATSVYAVSDYVRAAELSSRQLSRVCTFNKDPETPTNYDFEPIVDFGCSRVWAVNNSPDPQVNPRFASQFTPFGCNQRIAHVDHNHDWDYADINHRHGGW